MPDQGAALVAFYSPEDNRKCFVCGSMAVAGILVDGDDEPRVKDVVTPGGKQLTIKSYAKAVCAFHLQKYDLHGANTTPPTDPRV